MITRLEFRKRFRYNMITGIFTRLSDSKRAGTVHCRKKGYRVITIDHKRYQEHKLVRFYLFNDYHCEMDHKNGIRDDNKFKNLRKVTRLINCRKWLFLCY